MKRSTNEEIEIDTKINRTTINTSIKTATSTTTVTTASIGLLLKLPQPLLY